MSERNITFEIKEHLGVITEFDNGWSKELNIISWNGNAPKYDIRDWDSHHERMRKGVTLRESEFRKLVDLYLHNNSRKAVELGRSLEAGRKQRRTELAEQQRKNRESEEAEPVPADCRDLYAGFCSSEAVPQTGEEAAAEFCSDENEDAAPEAADGEAAEARLSEAAAAGGEEAADPSSEAASAVPF